jgi:hypothetical protein
METKQCLVCAKEFNVGILLDRRLSNSLEPKTLTGYGLCDEHNKLFKDEYIALIGIDESKSTVETNGNILPHNAYRTGNVAHVKYHVLEGFFNIPIDPKLPIIFVEDRVINKLQECVNANNSSKQTP